MKKEEVFIDLSKCTREELKSLPQILKKAGETHWEKIIFENDDFSYWTNFHKPYYSNYWTIGTSNSTPEKTELTYQEFIKLLEKPKTVSESLKEYFKNTSKEQVIKDWESTVEFDNVNSPKISELFKGEEGNEDFTKVTIEMEIWQLKNLRNYFGYNGKTPFEHLAFKTFDDEYKKLSKNLTNKNRNNETKNLHR